MVLGKEMEGTEESPMANLQLNNLSSILGKFADSERKDFVTERDNIHI